MKHSILAALLPALGLSLAWFPARPRNPRSRR
jgi:hypothetical protein